MRTDDRFRIAGIDPCEVCNGLGFGVTLFLQGCSHHCEGCHNPSTWDPNGGQLFDWAIMNQLEERCSDPNIRRLTISGGEPFDSPDATNMIASWFVSKFPEKSLWVYTGYRFEELVGSENARCILRLCDVLVDGSFILAERDITLAFRGSRNQRIIDIPATIIAGHIVELEVT